MIRNWRQRAERARTRREQYARMVAALRRIDRHIGNDSTADAETLGLVRGAVMDGLRGVQ